MGARFSAPVQTGPEAHPAPYTMGTRYFPGVKRPGHGVDHPPPSSVEVKEGVQLYTPLWAFVACSRVNFTCTLLSAEVKNKWNYTSRPVYTFTGVYRDNFALLLPDLHTHTHTHIHTKHTVYRKLLEKLLIPWLVKKSHLM